jgi:hypothetical protein
MKTTNKMEELSEKIYLLRQKKKFEWQLLQEQFKSTKEILKPANIIKNSFKEVISSPEIKSSLVNAAINLSTKFIATNFSSNPLNSPIKKIFSKVMGYFSKK